MNPMDARMDYKEASRGREAGAPRAAVLLPCTPPLRSLACAVMAALIAPLAPLAAGCDDKPRPWEGQQGPPAALTAASPGALASGAPARDADADAAAPDADTDTDAGAAPPAETVQNPVRVGGPWVRCYGNFRLSGEPLKDVTRLALLCGPENGMRRLTKQTLEGSVAEGQAPVTEPVRLVQGECYRVFAAAGRGVADLDVAVRSSRGVMIASDAGEDTWPIVQPDRPFCALSDDEATVEISARKGAGRFAAEVWVLRTPRREGGGPRSPGAAPDSPPDSPPSPPGE